MPGFIWWVLIGGFMGALGSWWMPGRPPRDITMSMILGLAGAAIGGAISTLAFGTDLLATGFDPSGVALAAAGAGLALAAYTALVPDHTAPPPANRIPVPVPVPRDRRPQ